MVSVPLQIRYWNHFHHRENVVLIALQAGHRQIVRAVDKEHWLCKESRLIGVEGVAVAERVGTLDSIDFRTQALR